MATCWTQASWRPHHRRGCGGVHRAGRHRRWRPRDVPAARGARCVPVGDSFRPGAGLRRSGPARLRLPRSAARGSADLGRLRRRAAAARRAASRPRGDRHAGHHRPARWPDCKPDQVPDLWWTSYEVATRCGSRIEVELPDGPHLDVLLVTGLSDSDPRALVEALAGHGTLGLVPPLAATNTIAGQPTVDTGRDPSRWLAVARSVGSGTAGGLAGVLTAEPRLDGVADVDTSLLGRRSAPGHCVVAGAVAALAQGRRELRADPRARGLGESQPVPARRLAGVARRRRPLRGAPRRRPAELDDCATRRRLRGRHHGPGRRARPGLGGVGGRRGDRAGR